MSMTWTVKLPDGSEVTAEAHSCRVTEGGALVFSDSDGQPLVAWAPGAWISIHRWIEARG